MIIAPLLAVLLLLKGGPEIPAGRLLLIHLLAVSLPEEVYFRGYLQEVAGNNYTGVVIVSLLFAFMHLPRFLSSGDPSALLTFFPSLLLGWLYMRKGNLLHPVVLHYLMNILFISYF